MTTIYIVTADLEAHKRSLDSAPTSMAIPWDMHGIPLSVFLSEQEAIEATQGEYAASTPCVYRCELVGTQERKHTVTMNFARPRQAATV